MTGTFHIVLAMKPTDGNFAENALRHGVAGLDIDGSRIGTDDNLGRPQGTMPQPMDWGNKSKDGETFRTEGSTQGRWPANVIIGHSDGCKKVGTKKVKPSVNNSTSKTSIGGRGCYGGGKERVGFDYADEDGMETVEEWECANDCAVRLLGEQSGELKSGDLRWEEVKADNRIYNTAGRFFKQVEQLPEPEELV